MVHSFRIHTSKVVAIAVTSDSSYLFSADENGVLIMSSILDKIVVKKLASPSEKTNILNAKISRNNQILYVVHSLYLEIFSITMKSRLLVIKESNIKHINFSSDDSKLFVYQRNYLNVYNTENYSLLYRQVFRSPTSTITFANNSSYYVLYRGALSKISPNPLLITTLTCIGKTDELSSYEKYVANIIRNKDQKHNKNFDN